jgi:uncharacterized membrane protein YuzA (DUF378 family)
MKALNLVTLALVIIGGINWGLVGLAQFDLVAAIFGGQEAPLARLVYGLVGLSALWQIVPLLRASHTNEVHAEAHARTHHTPRR